MWREKGYKILWQDWVLVERVAGITSIAEFHPRKMHFQPQKCRLRNKRDNAKRFWGWKREVEGVQACCPVPKFSIM